MKIYIVTTGGYSFEYQIKKVFTKREKAEEFLKWCEDGRIEEHETEDDLKVEGYFNLLTSYRSDKKESIYNPEIYIRKRFSDGVFPKEYTNVFCMRGENAKAVKVQISKVFMEEHLNEDAMTEKYKKMAIDISDEANKLLSEGIPESVISVLLSKKYSKM